MTAMDADSPRSTIMKPRIVNLAIKGFRAFRELNIEGLGRVNLITGRNNTGKSSVLEALRILASDASASVLGSILHSREEDLGGGEDSRRLREGESEFQLSSLFHGFPSLSSVSKPVLISSGGGQTSRTLSMEVEGSSEESRSEDETRIQALKQAKYFVDQDGARGLIPPPNVFYGEITGMPTLVIKTEGSPRKIPVDLLPDYLQRGLPSGWGVGKESGIPWVIVTPFGGEGTATLGLLWDRIALSDDEQEVVKALHIIDPGIVAVDMIGGVGTNQRRIAYVRSTSFPVRVPLRSYGDGLNRLFGIVLSMVNAKDGLLLIDEFENGMHHTVQEKVWGVIFDLASRLNIQVFATSHSWDAIEAFQKAASETPEEGVLVRLSRWGDDIASTLFREDELAIVTRDRIEVR